jgi:hypothetical protein
MSHFSVFVIGEPKTVLAPFCEQDEEYCTKHESSLKELKKDYKKYRKSDNYKRFLKEKLVSDNLISFLRYWKSYERFFDINDTEAINKADAEKHRYAVTKDGELVAHYEFYNDNAKWDWYQEGGRFSDRNGGHFIFKDGTTGDSGYVKDIDLDAMIEKARKSREEDYDTTIKKFGRIPKMSISWNNDIVPLFEKWSKLVKKHDYEVAKDICDWKGKVTEKFRDLYHNQPEVLRWKEIFNDTWSLDIENYCCTREEYVEKFELPVWAICDEDGWYEPTEMGWWAMHDDYDSKSWREQSIEVLRKNIKKAQEENPDLYITLVDCHI